VNAGFLVMGAAGLLASVISNSLSFRYARKQQNRNLLVRIRVAVHSLFGGKELENFFADYCELLSALGRLAVTQLVVLLIFSLPMVGIYQLTTRMLPAPSAPSNTWLGSYESIFMVTFMAGSCGLLVRRRM
jgi:hypothetical protein